MGQKGVAKNRHAIAGGGRPLDAAVLWYIYIFSIVLRNNFVMHDTISTAHGGSNDVSHTRHNVFGHQDYRGVCVRLAGRSLICHDMNPV